MEKNKNKHILIVEGFPPPHWWLLERNYRVTWFIPVDRLGERDGYVRKVGVPVNATNEEWIKMAKVINEIDPVDHVVNFREQNQDKTALIAQALQLRWHKIETVETINSKLLMRKKLNDAGVHNFKYSLIKNEEMLIDILRNWRIPVVLKPINASGSKGINMITNEEEAIKSWEIIRNLQFSEAIVEEYIEGEEFSVESFTQNGKHNIICITKKYKDPLTSIELGHSVPAIINKNVEEQITKYINKVLSVLEVENGMTHTELFVTSEGPVIVETHLRMGGDYIPNLVKEALEVDMLDIWMKSIIENIEFVASKKVDEQKFAAIWYKTSDINGKVKEIKNIDLVKQMDNILMIEIEKKVEDTVSITSDSFSRLCFVIAKGKSPNEALANAQLAINKIEYVITTEGCLNTDE